MGNSKIIAVTGTAAAGKTSIIHRLSSALGLPSYPEDVDDNPLLAAWYQDRLKWNYWIQLFFHSRRVVFQYLAEKEGGILERTLMEDLIFLELSLEDCTVDAERRMLLRYKDEVENTIRLHRPPDHVIYLTVSPEKQRQRMVGRQRESEDSIDQGFMDRLNRKYVHHVEVQRSLNVSLVVDTDQLDVDQVFQKVLEHVSTSSQPEA